MTQSTIRVDGANMVEFKVVDDDHSVSWKVATKGRLEFVARAHNVGEYLALSVEESPYGLNARNRATFATLEKPAAQALRNMLCDTFGTPPAKLTTDDCAQAAALLKFRDETLPELFRWLARAKFERFSDEKKAAEFGERMREVLNEKT